MYQKCSYSPMFPDESCIPVDFADGYAQVWRQHSKHIHLKTVIQRAAVCGSG